MTWCCYIFVTALALLSAGPRVLAQSCRKVRTENLQNVLDTLTQPRAANAGNYCSSIELTGGVHVLSTQMFFSNELEDLEILGPLDQDVFVECEFSVQTNYTWYFSGITSLKIQNLHFRHCPTPLRIDSASSIEITNCTFRYFSEAVLDIFNCHHSQLKGVTLEHNRGSGISTVSFRGNTGGVSFGFNNLPEQFDSPYIHVSDSVFNNNSAEADSAFLTSSQAFARRVFTGRGGALALFAYESRVSINVTITDCMLTNNTARSFGGAVYILPGGKRDMNHNVLFERCWFVSNKAGICGGGVQVTYPTPGPRSNPHLVRVIDCHVINNTAPFNGGGMYISSITHGDGNSIDIQNSHFQHNSAQYGGALVLKSFALTLDKSALAYHSVIGCTFTGNTGISGVVSVWFVSARFSGTNRFTENTGNALQVISSVVHLSGELHFVNNSGGDDSALHLLSFSQAFVSNGLFINFAENSGRFGAGVYVDNQYHSSLVYSRPAACFLRHEGDYTPEQWENITLQFSDNRAILASNMYLSRLDWTACSSPFNYASHYLKSRYSDIIDWPIWEFGESVNTGYEDPTLSQWAVQTSVKRLDSPNTTVKAWPGRKFTFVMEGIGEYDNPTSTLARLHFSPYNHTKDVNIRFIPEVIVVGPDPISGLLTRQFTVFHEIETTTTSATVAGPLGVVEIQALDAMLTDVKSATFVLVGELCPSGYVLQGGSSQSVCLCNEDIPEILLCKDDQQTIVIEVGKWAVYVPTREEANMQFYVCPAGYCRCKYDTVISNSTCVYSYSHADPDLQCSCVRKGTLCGECKRKGDGVSALLNECVSCTKASGLLILALVAVDIAVIALLTLVNISIPSWCYPFIFYINLAPIAGLYFPQSFTNIGKYLYFIGSAFSFYFAYDFCLYENMSSEIAYLLRFLPLFLAIMTCTPIVVTRSTQSKSKRRVLSNHGVWSVMLLMYTHVVYTSLTVLYCPTIIDSHGEMEPRWFMNGNVRCFTGGHTALAVLSALVLMVAGALIPGCLLLSLGYLEKFPKIVQLFKEPVTAPYRERLGWWSAVDLARRLILPLFLVALPGNEGAPVLILALYTTVYVYVQPYKLKLTNMIEAGVNVNFFLLLILNTTAFFREEYLTFPAPAVVANGSNDCSDSVSGIAAVSWILLPFYYLPLLVFCLVVLIKLLQYVRKIYITLRKKCVTSSRAQEIDQRGLVDNENDGGVTAVDYTSWSVELSTDGFVHLKTQT